MSHCATTRIAISQMIDETNPDDVFLVALSSDYRRQIDRIPNYFE